MTVKLQQSKLKREIHMTRKMLAVFLSAAVLLSGCQYLSPAPELTPTPAVPQPPTSTPVPVTRTLTVCLGQEPNTLYPYAGPNAAARSVLEAIQDGPVDSVGYDYQPVILSQLPSLENGDAQIASVSVAPGGKLVNSAGEVAVLEKGTQYRPAGCRADDCVVTYDGVAQVSMDQMNVTFRMRSDVTWSDGTPLTAEDSVYAFSLGSDVSSLSSTYLVDRTATYEAADATTVQWWGIPGFIDPTYFMNFWAPAPRHVWGQFTPEELQKTDVSSRAPLGWGPYVIQEWLPADHITLTRNTNYFRFADRFPHFDTLIFRFIADPNSAISELAAGRCDLLDPTVHLDGQAELLQQMQDSGELRASFAPGMTIEWLGVGIKPASYDDGYDPVFSKDRADTLSDPRTRQGIAYCLDRKKVVDTVLFGLTSVPSTFLPPEHPLYNSDASVYEFNPTAGIALLEEVGWRDTDGNPATPRQAVSVRNIGAGTQLLLNYYTTGATQRRQVVEILSQSLAQCGIGLNVQYMSQNDLYSPGPEGPLFGRKFDLLEYSMGVEGIEPPCEWFVTSEIPTAGNHWIGTNVTGYSNPEYDAVCASARQALPDEPAYSASYRQAQVSFASDLPSIPLYYRLRVAASRPDFCHFDLDPSGSPLWNIESFDYGPTCQQ
jgi:peptide/nickel transport system substrate-binding protein